MDETSRIKAVAQGNIDETQRLTKPFSDNSHPISSTASYLAAPPAYADDDHFTFTFDPPRNSIVNPFAQSTSESPFAQSGLFNRRPLVDFTPSKSLNQLTHQTGWSKTRIWPPASDTMQIHETTKPSLAEHTLYNTGAYSQQPIQGTESFSRRLEILSNDDELSQNSSKTSFTFPLKNSDSSKSTAASSPIDGPSDVSAHDHGVHIGTLDPALFVVDSPKDATLTDRDYDDMMTFIPGYNQVRKEDADLTRIQDYRNAPLFSRRVESALSKMLAADGQDYEVFSQFGLLGLQEPTRLGSFATLQHQEREGAASNNLVFANMDAPWSAFICGSQGAGKSHTLSCLLENTLLKTRKLGKLPEPLSGIVFHYDKFSGTTTTQICEAAYLCSQNIPVTVLVSPSNVWAMQRMYRDMPGMPIGAPVPTVLPLYLTEKQLDISRILKLMAVDPTEKQPPLYMEVVMNILREMAMAGPGEDGFSYQAFRRRLQETEWVRGQHNPLSMRLSLLDSFMAPSATTASTRPAAATEDIWNFSQGSLTVIDLSDPFVDENDACALFSICLSIFLETRSACGRVIALDEAHKFLTKTGEAKILTDTLTSVMREQRHTGSRVFIATQEPTLSPTLIDLANVTIVHRFLSPAWYEMLRHHLAGAKREDNSGNDDLFETIVALETGQALMFCPTALLDLTDEDNRSVKPLGSGFAKLRIRSRLTADGGKSVLAMDKSFRPKGFATTNVPMHIVSKPAPAMFQYRSKNAQHGKMHKHSGSALTSDSAQNAAFAPVQAAESSATVLSPAVHPEGNTPRSSTNTMTRSTAKLSADEKLHDAVREHMRICFHSNRWDNPQGVSWKKLWIMVEQSLGFPAGRIEALGKSEQCKTVAVEEMARCRKELKQLRKQML